MRAAMRSAMHTRVQKGSGQWVRLHSIRDQVQHSGTDDGDEHRSTSCAGFDRSFHDEHDCTSSGVNGFC